MVDALHLREAFSASSAPLQRTGAWPLSNPFRRLYHVPHCGDACVEEHEGPCLVCEQPQQEHDDFGHSCRRRRYATQRGAWAVTTPHDPAADSLVTDS